eukprot:scaffold6061_cov94-Isochrysis_galbana.AAC.6
MASSACRVRSASCCVSRRKCLSASSSTRSLLSSTLEPSAGPASNSTCRGGRPSGTMAGYMGGHVRKGGCRWEATQPAPVQGPVREGRVCEEGLATRTGRRGDVGKGRERA